MAKTPLTIQTDSVAYDGNTQTINVVFSPTNLILIGEISHSTELSIKDTTPELAIASYNETARLEILKNLPAKFANMFE